MYNTNNLMNIQTNKSWRNILLIGLVFLFIGSMLSSYFIFFTNNLEGAQLGYVIFPLFVVSEVPILLNYFYLVSFKSRLMKYLDNSVKKNFYYYFEIYYTPSLVFHSILYTIVIGLVTTHVMLLVQQTTYCIIFMLVFCLIWIIEYYFWSKNWLLYPVEGEKHVILYWIHWLIVFGLFVGLPFHVKNFNVFWMVLVSTMTFIPLFWLILTGVSKIATELDQNAVYG
ncbi:MAG: hypothetical protein ACTSPV_06245 [Candidatus Hodarchaeales archaeon]